MMRDDSIPSNLQYSELAEGIRLAHKPKLKYKDYIRNTLEEGKMTGKNRDADLSS